MATTLFTTTVTEVYDFEGDGTAVKDAAHDLTEVNTPTYGSTSPPQGSQYADLDATTDEHYTLADEAHFDTDSGDYSFAFWLNSAVNDPQIATKGGLFAANGWSILGEYIGGSSYDIAVKHRNASSNLGAIVDGQEITQLFRYYRVKARLLSDLDRSESSRIQSITASFVTYTTLTDTKGLGYNVTVSDVSALTTKIDFFKPSTVGQISVDTFFNQEMSTYFSIPRKNHLVKVFQGFKGMAEADYIPYYYGIIGNAPINTGEIVTIDIDDYTATWSKPIPEKWTSSLDDVMWSNVHPIDVLLDIFKNYLDVRDSYIDHSAFDTVKAAYPGWVVTRTITGNSEKTEDLINELRQLMSCFLIPQPDGKVSIKLFDSTASAVASISDDDFITKPGLSYDPQYKEFFNHILTYYGWDGDGDKLSDYAALDDYTNSTSITAWKEEVYKVIKDKWTLSGNTSQVTARRTILNGVFGDAPVLLTGSISKRLLYLEVGDMVNITITRYPKASGFGITNKKFLLINRNYNYGDSNIKVSFLEV